MSRKLTDVQETTGKWLCEEMGFHCRWRNVDDDSADVTSASKSVPDSWAENPERPVVTVDNLAGGTTRW